MITQHPQWSLREVPLWSTTNFCFQRTPNHFQAPLHSRYFREEGTVLCSFSYLTPFMSLYRIWLRTYGASSVVHATQCKRICPHSGESWFSSKRAIYALIFLLSPWASASQQPNGSHYIMYISHWPLRLFHALITRLTYADMLFWVTDFGCQAPTV